MTQSELADFTDQQDAEYARQKVNAGDWPAGKALDLARAEHAGLHDGSLRARGHSFVVAVDAATSAHMGWVWYGPSPLPERPAREAFLFQLTVEPTQRGRGTGRAIFAALEERLRSEGYDAVFLNVFLWNVAALAMYERAGFVVVQRFASSAHMRKGLA